MSESPEQFRKRIAKVSFSAERSHTGLRVFTAAEHDRHQNMAEAVYVQAIRDMMAWLDERAEGPGQHISITDGISLYEAIEHRLEERGIDVICAEDIMDFKETTVKVEHHETNGIHISQFTGQLLMTYDEANHLRALLNVALADVPPMPEEEATRLVVEREEWLKQYTQPVTPR